MSPSHDQDSTINLGPIRDARVSYDAQSPEDVRSYYNSKTAAYLEGFGEVFQGSRPESTEDLLRYIVDSADIGDGMNILDAGCGVCGPACWIAAHQEVTIQALTISGIQVEEAKKRVLSQGLGDRITVREGDFHELSSLYPPESFDRALFLETICHAKDYRRVLQEAMNVLKPGGFIYIKDFFCQDFRSKPELLPQQTLDLESLNQVYHLALPDLPSLLDVVLEVGFRLKYLREPQYKPAYGPWLSYEQLSGTPWIPVLPFDQVISGFEMLCFKPFVPPDSADHGRKS